MKADDLRQSFIEFFESKGHLARKSAPLVPKNDPSLLWINAGMTPLKPYFSGSEDPPRERMVTSQKCIRTNDIENVGKTARHQTFFEMLGNFSFGNYFKQKAIEWSWEYVTEVLQFPEEDLIITIFHEDDQSFDIWHDDIGVPPEKIIRRGMDENFWQIGTGPCGPCSEIHLDRGKEYGLEPVDELSDEVLEREGDRFLELWNLVFTQYDYTEAGEYVELPQKNIDTGMGLERTASVLQGVDSNFEIDIMFPIIREVEKQTGCSYDEKEEIKTALRVISDHIRGVTMAVFDGVIPSNEGRGYVLRRLLRRASRYGRDLGYSEPFLYTLVEEVIDVMSGGYPEIGQRKDFIEEVVKSEERSFLRTLEDGLDILEDQIEEMESENRPTMSGKRAFELYDTYGFPLDITRDILSEKGLEVDEKGFEEAMKEQRQRARQARTEGGFAGGEVEIYEEILENMENKPEFVGYEKLEQKAEIIALIQDGEEVENLSAGEEGEVILDVTPFYAESGGQVGDKGSIFDDDLEVEVNDVRDFLGLPVHQVKVKEGELTADIEVKLEVDSTLRRATARNHTATHLLHQALMEVLGDHVTQSGSLVAPDRLRFDFTHFGSLEEEEIAEIEDRVNAEILRNREVESRITSVKEAKEGGAQALFEEEYGEEVRVIEIDDFSLELCGGTHVQATGEIGLFKIIDESSIAAGIRRIEATTGTNSLNYLRRQQNRIDELAGELNSDENSLLDAVKYLKEEQEELEQKVESLQDRLASQKAEELLNRKEKVDGVDIIMENLQRTDRETLRILSDELIEHLDNGFILLASTGEESVFLIARAGSQLVESGFDAGDMIGEIAAEVGGGGGGRPDMAQAGGSNPENIDRAFAAARRLVEENL
ncbi:alanine--tRNA ligase [Halarsenatibacter silvermanii]|uniref:Alanine--tRNA ligase n=1 Tax=Halarsenatibacter silvermanii TaxID=321763 RepID=A0A1G9K325_9FIRM|nr:alanine--tRNA ligase [Halarsenatibacter silvermanii]SDL43623.1 alanyl-tRNA synthetase [Halarsenatibacter silvermanii]